MNNNYTVKSIGKIKIEDYKFYLEINQEYIKGLNGLEGFNYINVLFWCHLLDSSENRNQLEVKKPYQKAPDKLGTFATRSPARPNPIALTPVYISHIDYKKGIIQIPYIDAENDSPIIDIKPYTPSLDRIKNVKVPDWCSHWPKWQEDSASFDWESEFTHTR